MLSIVIPALNEEKHLPHLLASIKKQDFKNYEVILADAGSKDKTLQAAKDFGCKVVSGGLPAKGRNKGAEAAKGSLVLFMDADNILTSPSFLKSLIEEFEKRKLGLAAFPIYPVGKKIDKIIYKTYNEFIRLSRFPSAFNSVLVRKDIFEKVGGFDESVKLAEDHYFAWQASKHGKFGFIKAPPVLTSARRFEKEGRLVTYSKSFLAGAYILFFGPIRSDIFKYRFDCYNEKDKN